MTLAKVVDTSALAAVIFGEPAQSAVEQRLSGATLYAPVLIDFEMANVCLKKIRERPADRAAVIASYRNYEQFVIAKLPVVLGEAIELAERLRLSLYDASFLWLSRSLGVDLVTLDAQLQGAIAKP